jgi:hypothetical protein
MVENNTVVEELKKIICLPLIDAGRACDLIWFVFGGMVKREDERRGSFQEAAEYSLHVQCSWRLTDPERIITGSADKFIPNSESNYDDNFDWDVQGANRCDEQLKALFSGIENRFIVKDIVADKFGGVKIYFTEDIVLEVFPDNSTEEEAWRFFRRGWDDPHLVVTGTGICWE